MIQTLKKPQNNESTSKAASPISQMVVNFRRRLYLRYISKLHTSTIAPTHDEPRIDQRDCKTQHTWSSET